VRKSRKNPGYRLDLRHPPPQSQRGYFQRGSLRGEGSFLGKHVEGDPRPLLQSPPERLEVQDGRAGGRHGRGRGRPAGLASLGKLKTFKYKAFRVLFSRKKLNSGLGEL